MESSFIDWIETHLEPTVCLAIDAKEILELLALEDDNTVEINDDLFFYLSRCRVFDMALPHELGGIEADPISILNTVEMLSIIDGSVGWLAGIHAPASAFVSFFDPNEAKRLFRQGPVTFGGSSLPSGQTICVDNGYRISGHWRLVTGASRCDFVSLATQMETGEIKWFMVKKKDIKVKQNWDTFGLRKTGGNDVIVEKAYVPNTHIFSLMDPPQIDRPLYRFPIYGLLTSCLAMVAIGIAKRAICDLLVLVERKIPRGDTQTLNTRSDFQAFVAQAEAKWESIRKYLLSSIENAWKTAVRGESGADTLLQVRMASTLATRTSVEIVSKVFEFAGTNAIYVKYPFEKCLRDVWCVNQHFLLGGKSYTLAGRKRLGMGEQLGF